MKGAGVQYLIVIEMVVRMEKECKNTNEEENMKKNVKKIISFILSMLVIISTAVTPAMAAGTKEATTEVKSVTASGLWTTVLNLEFEDTTWMDNINKVIVNDKECKKSTINSFSSDTNIWEVGSATGAYGSYKALKLAVPDGKLWTVKVSADGYKDLTVKITKETVNYTDTYKAEVVSNSGETTNKTYTADVTPTVSAGQVAKLRRNNYVVNRIKPDNEQIYYIIDTINEAINAGKQISFQYYDYTGLKKKVLKNKGEVYKLSPYKLLWCGDYYYVLGYSEKKSKVINFRVDRIASKPEILDKDIIPMPDDFDIENYTKEVFFMFSGEKVRVDLRCDNSLMKTMVDRFGEDVTTLAYDMTSFRVQTEVSASPTFFGWVFGFNGKVQILAPESVKEQYRQMIAKADEDMQESE